jgi:hypothetical protein
MHVRRVLVPLVVLALALALFLWRGCGEGPVVDLASDVAACAANLREIHAGLVVRSLLTKQPPQDSGIAFFASLIASGEWEDTPENRARLTCPGPNAEPVPEGTDYRDLAALTPASSAYAGRDTIEFPLSRFPSGGAEIEPLIACDGARGLNHEGCLNVLYSDGSVVTFTLEQEIARGRLPPDASTIQVGKGSPIPDLGKLVGDRP